MNGGNQFTQHPKLKDGTYAKHVIGQIQSLSERQTGKLKFFDDGTNFGFIILD